MPSAGFRVEALDVVYPDGGRALSGVTLQVPAGARVALLGASGAGKSTLLRCVSSALRPTAGAVFVGDTRVDTLGGRQLRTIRARVASIYQQFHLLPRLPVRLNVLAGALSRCGPMAGWFRRFPRGEIEAADAALARVGLTDFADRRADRLSGGQKQRVAIARALLQRPDLLLADEPIAALDPRSSEIVLDLLRRLHEEDGLTVVASLHQVDHALSWAQRIVGMAGGRIVFDGPPAALDGIALDTIYPRGTSDAND